MQGDLMCTAACRVSALQAGMTSQQHPWPFHLYYMKQTRDISVLLRFLNTRMALGPGSRDARAVYPDRWENSLKSATQQVQVLGATADTRKILRAGVCLTGGVADHQLKLCSVRIATATVLNTWDVPTVYPAL